MKVATVLVNSSIWLFLKKNGKRNCLKLPKFIFYYNKNIWEGLLKIPLKTKNVQDGKFDDLL